MMTKRTTERWQFDFLLILLIVAIVLGLLLSPIIWQGIRERQRRAAVRENLQQIQKAIHQYKLKNQKTPGVEPALPEQPTPSEK